MSHDLTTEAVRMALNMSQLRAEVASRNIASAATPGAQASRLDFAQSQGLLEQVMGADAASEPGLLQALVRENGQPKGGAVQETVAGAINLDEQVADMASASLKYQAMTESLNRHFGLLRLAITGRN